MIDYTDEVVKTDAKRVLHEAIKYIDGDTVKPEANSEVLMMVADATGVSDFFEVR